MARTIEFDRSEVLEKSVDVFWKNGYGNTSVSNLVDATNLKPGSIYAAFDSKEGLFIASLNHYGEKGSQILKQIIDEANSPLEGIKEFFIKILSEIKDDDHKGCLLVNTILEVDQNNHLIQDEVNKHLTNIELIILSALDTAHKDTKLPNNITPKELAKFLMVNIWGIRVLAKTNPPKESLESIQKQILLALGV